MWGARIDLARWLGHGSAISVSWWKAPCGVSTVRRGRENASVWCDGRVGSIRGAFVCSGAELTEGRHKNDFAENAATFLTARTWRDLADFVMLWTIDDADRVRPAGGGKFCHDRYFYLANSHGRVVLTQRFIGLFVPERGVIVVDRRR